MTIDAGGAIGVVRVGGGGYGGDRGGACGVVVIGVMIIRGTDIQVPKTKVVLRSSQPYRQPLGLNPHSPYTLPSL